jgi:hypothetical protein
MSILWGKDRDLDYWAALQTDVVPDAERRAMVLLASMSDERRFSFYCLAGMFPAMGNVTKRIYMVRRWTTVLELEDGRPRASWCILTQDRQIAPETDHVVAMKNLLEGSEMNFREVGNAFHYSEDPFRGRVDPKTAFPNPYYNEIGPPRKPDPRFREQAGDWNEDSALEFREREGWIKTLKLKAELQRGMAMDKANDRSVQSAAAFRPQLLRDALIERAKDWVRIPPKERYKLPPTSFERTVDRAIVGINNIGMMYGLGGNNTNAATTWTADTNTANIFCNATTIPIHCNPPIA